MSDQLDSLELAVEQRANRNTYDCCVRCDRLTESWFQIKRPGTDVCEFCSVITIESGAEAD